MDMPDFARMLFGPGDEPTIDEVQQPVTRPAPVRRPVEAIPGGQRPRQPAQEVAPAPGPPPAVQMPPMPDFAAEAFGTRPAPSVQTPAATGGPDPNAEPDAETFMGRRLQDIRGKKDKRFADLPSMGEVLRKDGDYSYMRGAWSALTGATDKELGTLYKFLLKDRFIKQEDDANGFPIIVYRDRQGKESKAYVNKPGVDLEDAVRFGAEVAPFVATGGAVGAGLRGAHLAGRMVAQGLTGAATAVGQDAAGVVTGYREPDLPRTISKAGIAAGGGAAGEVLAAGGAALWRRYITEPRFYNRTAGTLTPEGEAALQKGLGEIVGEFESNIAIPPDAAQKFAQAMAQTGDPATAWRQVISNKFGIARTRGELTGNQAELIREQRLRGSDASAGEMQMLDRARDQQIENAARGFIRPGEPGIAGQIAPHRADQVMLKGDLGAAIRGNMQAALANAKAFEGRAWKEVEDIIATPEALTHLDTALAQGLAKRGVSMIEEGITPTTAKMSQMIEAFQAGEMPVAGSKFVSGSNVPGNVDMMRRRLLAVKDEAATPTDQKAANAMYGAFNDWVVDAAAMSGDITKAAKLQVGRQITKLKNEVFKGPPDSPEALILQRVLATADTPEAVIDALFSSAPGNTIRPGSYNALVNLKRAYLGDEKGKGAFLPPDEGLAAWNDLGLAYWLRFAERKTRDLAGPAQMSSNIKTMLNSQRSIAKLLYTPEQRNMALSLAHVLDDVKKKNPNTSWSGITVGQIMSDIGNALISMFGFNSPIAKVAGRAALEVPPINWLRSGYGKQAAQNAYSGVLPTIPPPALAGPGSGTAGWSERQ